MKNHGTIIVMLFFGALLASLVGFGAATIAKIEAEKAAEAHYSAHIAALNEEREKLSRQVEELQKIKIQEVTLTAYSPTVEECGPDPVTTASMTKVRRGIVAVSQDLFAKGWIFGKKVYVKGHGVYEIADLMHKRRKSSMDIFFPDTEEARRFGVKQVTVALLAG